MALYFQLTEALIFATDLYHRIAIDAEITTFIAYIFSFMPCPQTSEDIGSLVKRA